MTDKDETLIVLDYNSWLFAQADKLGVNINDVGDAVRKHENRMRKLKQKLFKEYDAAHSHD